MWQRISLRSRYFPSRCSDTGIAHTTLIGTLPSTGEDWDVYQVEPASAGDIEAKMPALRADAATAGEGA